MNRAKLLDLCGCEGGASAGYYRAGFDIYVIDMDANRLRHNPHPSLVGDALDALVQLISGGGLWFVSQDGTRRIFLRLSDFAAIHVSPPCQGYTRGNAGKVTDWPMLISDFRALLERTGLPYVIENVRDAAWDMHDPTLLCGCMFDLTVRDFTCTSPGQHDGTCDTVNGVTVHLERGRLFETNWELTAPRKCEGEGQPRNNHPSHDWVAGAYGGARRDKYEARYIRHGGYVPPDKELVKALLGIEHDMTWQGLYECLPPRFTEHVGAQLLAHIGSEVAA